MTTPVPYIPGSVVTNASWLLLNSRSGVRYILVDTRLLQTIETHGPWHKDDAYRTSVDPDGHDRVWSAKRNSLDGSSRSVRLHRWLLKAQDIDTGENLKPDLIGDHRNRRRWDNRLANLRLVTPDESNTNQSARKGKDPRDWGISERVLNKGKNHYWRIDLQRNRVAYYNKYYHQDQYTLDEVRAIRDQAYFQEWGRHRHHP